ncbi:MAG TPA: SMC family ATPase [Methylomirabilota bacterium]|jgi:exonuclease SbcC|nr:SMC family ATPase [Methylomirabilota bacterium]
MRPQKLTLKNFMPFRSTESQVQEVDFSNLDLFAITGPMASGKSSLIDAIVWCLYGRTARYGADSKGVISAGENICEVTLDFTIGSRWFRAVRRTGKTTESGLSELENGEWIQDTSGSERLTERIESLLGLDFDSFSKTVILPQGKYAEFLSSEPGKRRDLLEKILELGVYKRVIERARDLEGRSKTRAETIRETLAQPQYAGVTRAMVEQRQSEIERLAQDIAQTGRQEEMLRGLAQQVEAVTTLMARCESLRQEEQMHAQEHALAQAKLTAMEERLRLLMQSLHDVSMEREQLGYDPRRHAVVKRAAEYLHEHDEACQTVESKSQALVRVQRELEDLARQIGDQTQTFAQARRAYEEQNATLQAAIAADGDAAALTEKLNDATRWKEVLQEQERLREQQHVLTRQLAEAQHALTTQLEQEQAKEQELRALQQRRDHVREEEQEKRQQETEANHLGKDLQEAAREEKRVAQELEEARAAVAAKEQELRQQQEVVAQAEQREQEASLAVEENRKRNEIAHLRTMLHAGEPCPVCLAPVSEVPATAPETRADQTALQRNLERAKTALTQARQALQQIETAAATARAKSENLAQELARRTQTSGAARERFLAKFPGFSSLKDALTAVQAQRQALASLLKELETQAQLLEKERQESTRRREQAQRTETTLSESLRHTASSLDTNAKQLARLELKLEPYRTAGKDPAVELSERRQRLVHLEQEVRARELTKQQVEKALDALTTRKIQTEGARDVLQSEHAAAVAQAERLMRAVRENLELAAASPVPTLGVIEQELAELARRQALDESCARRMDSLRKEQTETERSVAALQADVQAHEGFLRRTMQALSQKEQELVRAQTTLQDAIENSGLSGIGPDGDGVKEQLTSVHEHGIALRERRSRLEAEIVDLERRCTEKEREEQKLREAENESRLAADLRKLLGAEFTDYLSEGAIKALMHDASAHLQKLTQNRYSFKIEYKRRTIELLIVDHEDQQRTRPTHSLSGGETFLASLAIALALSQSFREIATGRAAKTSTECLILDEGFGTLDREGLQLVTETLQELRGEEGRMVGIITHVEEVAAAMPTRIEVRKGSRSSTIAVTG